jgi:hypothetical protein
MRPPPPDIAIPPVPAGLEWVGRPVKSSERLVAARPALVHFFDFAQLNSVRTLPYLRTWHERYAADGLAIVGVHSPRFPFTQDAAAVAAAAERLGIDWSIAVDREFSVWRLYEPHGWPALFLWGRGGALRWYHLGEGEYAGTEGAIREALEEAGAKRDWHPTVEPLRPSDAPGAEVIAPTPEQFPGGSTEEPWSPTAETPSIALSYQAGGAYAAVDGAGEIAVRLDDAELEPVRVAQPGLVELTVHERTERHRMALAPSSELRIYSLQFAAAPAP